MKTIVSYNTIKDLTVSKEITAEEITEHVSATDYFDLDDVLFHLNDVVEDYLGLECEIKNGMIFMPDLVFIGDNLYEFCHEIEVRLKAEECGF